MQPQTQPSFLEVGIFFVEKISLRDFFIKYHVGNFFVEKISLEVFRRKYLFGGFFYQGVKVYFLSGALINPKTTE